MRRRNACALGRLHGTAVHENALDRHGRRDRIGLDPVGVDDDGALDVGNQRRPSRAFQAAGCVKPLHSAERMPSARPNAMDVTDVRFAAASASSSERATR